ncbi:MFS transporter [Cellulomonas sp. 73-92]|uniref:MFS transporter n=1 Tax=Cellulomonas sp. 73-92 TaxID=1895740 RepID=UPI000B269969|nr:MFS transporter [Cellulomonas sp. 73-92]
MADVSTQNTTPALGGPTTRRTARPGVVLAVTCLALGVVVSAMASLNVALPDIAVQTHADQTQQSWIIDAYSLVFASLLLPAGALGDRFGRRRALVVGLLVYGAASVGAALTTSPEVLIALRGVAGAGAALVMPATLSTITGTFPREQRARAVSIWAAVAGAAGVLGLLASGLLLQAWTWPAVFWFNAALVVVALTGTLVAVPESAEAGTPRLDVVGALLAAGAVGVLVHAVIQAPADGWGSHGTLAGLVVGAVLLASFVVWELRREHPLLDPRLFRNRRFAAGSISITLQFFALFGFMFVLMQYLQLVRGDSALRAALSLLAMPLGMVPMSRLSPALTARFGAPAPWAFGLVAVGAGLALLAQLGVDSPYPMVATGLVMLGAGLGLAMPPATTAITDALPQHLQNVGSAVNDLGRELGGALGIAVLASLLDGAYRAQLQLPAGVPARAAEAAQASLAMATAVGGAVVEPARAAFVDGLHLALLVAAGAALLAAAVVTVLLRGRRAAAPSRVGRSSTRS